MEIAYTPEFKRNLRRLAKKYRHIRSDIDPVRDDAGNNIRGFQFLQILSLQGIVSVAVFV